MIHGALVNFISSIQNLGVQQYLPTLKKFSSALDMPAHLGQIGLNRAMYQD